jgi:hypothetical protein
MERRDAIVPAGGAETRRLPSLKLSLTGTNMPRSVLADTCLPTAAVVTIDATAIHLQIDLHDTLGDVGHGSVYRTFQKKHLLRLQTPFALKTDETARLFFRDPLEAEEAFWIELSSSEPYWIKLLAKLVRDELDLMVAPF